MLGKRHHYPPPPPPRHTSLVDDSDSARLSNAGFCAMGGDGLVAGTGSVPGGFGFGFTEGGGRSFFST